MAARRESTLAPLELVAAVARNGVIGRGGTLPWHLPDDLRHFKALTSGHTVIMGRKTFESIRRPLPNRRNIVVSRTLSEKPHPGVEIASSLAEAIGLAAASDATGPAMVVGGGELYAAAIPLARAMHLTELDEDVEGDAYFPEWDRSAWTVATEVRHQKDARHAMGFDFRTYVRENG